MRKISLFCAAYGLKFYMKYDRTADAYYFRFEDKFIHWTFMAVREYFANERTLNTLIDDVIHGAIREMRLDSSIWDSFSAELDCKGD